MDRACNLIVDSCCDLPYDAINRPGVQLVKFPYFFEDAEFEDDMFHTLEAKVFYGRMRKGEQPTTSQASLVALTSAFTAAALQGVPTVYLCFSSGLSATYDQAVLVAGQIRDQYPGFELHVVDTRLASTAEALLVFEALRQQERGLTARELADWAEEARNFVNVYFMVEDLDCLRRGGRIPATVAVVGAKLDAKPILTIATDGTLAVKGVARGRKKGLRTLADLYFERADITESQPYVCTGNADAEKDMKRLEDMILKEVEKNRAKPQEGMDAAALQEPLFIETSIGPVIGSHVGPGMVSLVFWGPDRREEVSVADRIARKIRKQG